MKVFLWVNKVIFLWDGELATSLKLSKLLKIMDWIVDKPIAHRGLHRSLNRGSSVPENSLAAFEAAVKQGYPFELDIQLLADGGLVVFHDQDLSRLTGVKGKLSEQNSQSVKQLKLLGSDQHVPLLDEVFDLVKGKVPILIEIKSDGKVGELEQNLRSKLSDYSGEYAVMSFNPYSVSWFKQNAPQILRGQLSGDYQSSNLAWQQKFMRRNLLVNLLSSPNFIGYDIRALPYLPVSIARQIFNYPVLAWTVKTEDDKLQASKYADNIIFEGIDP